MAGMVHVYTGDGKGKTTAAFGLAVRAAGHGKHILFAQFLKGQGPDSGEVIAAKKHLLDVEILRFAQVHPLFDPTVDPAALAQAVQRDFARASRLAREGDFDLVVLDEIHNCVDQNLLPIASLLDLIRQKPEHLELVLTGRGGPPEVVTLADYVTEMKMVKHPAETKRTPARKGIEF